MMDHSYFDNDCQLRFFLSKNDVNCCSFLKGFITVFIDNSIKEIGNGYGNVLLTYFNFELAFLKYSGSLIRHGQKNIDYLVNIVWNVAWKEILQFSTKFQIKGTFYIITSLDYFRLSFIILNQHNHLHTKNWNSNIKRYFILAVRDCREKEILDICKNVTSPADIEEQKSMSDLSTKSDSLIEPDIKNEGVE